MINGFGLISIILIAFILISCTKGVEVDMAKANPNKLISEKPLTFNTTFENITSECTSFENLSVIKIVKYNYNNFDFIHVYGISKIRIINVVSSINNSYFEGITQLNIVYGKRIDVHSDIAGLYVPNIIFIYIYKESDNWLQYKILHELKHHYCWKTKKDLTHDKCFLNTPIDKEYGFIK